MNRLRRESLRKQHGIFSVRADVETKSYKTPFQITYDDGTKYLKQINTFMPETQLQKKTADTPKADPTPTPDTAQNVSGDAESGNL